MDKKYVVEYRGGYDSDDKKIKIVDSVQAFKLLQEYRDSNDDKPKFCIYELGERVIDFS